MSTIRFNVNDRQSVWYCAEIDAWRGAGLLIIAGPIPKPGQYNWGTVTEDKILTSLWGIQAPFVWEYVGEFD